MLLTLHTGALAGSRFNTRLKLAVSSEGAGAPMFLALRKEKKKHGASPGEDNKMVQRSSSITGKSPSSHCCLLHERRRS